MKPAIPLRVRASTATAKTVDPTLNETTPHQGTTKMIANTNDVLAVTKENFDAVTTATKIWTAGVQDLTAQIANSAKASLEEAIAAFKALTSVKSVKEAIGLQSTYGKNMVAMTLSETGRLADASIKLTEQTLAPITARVAATVDVFAKAA